jgi:hypothetical protein
MIKKAGIAAVLVAAVVPAVAIAGSATDRATGGGQVLFSDKGAGNTIAFTARGTAEAAEGRVTFIDRSVGTGQAQEKFHGIVQCLFVNDNYAELAGVERDSGAPFTLRVWDNGEGANAENDLIFFDDVADDPRCGEEDDDDDQSLALARGNAQVYDAE